MSILTDPGLVLGVDTHADTHTAAVCDSAARLIEVATFPTTPDGYGELLAWADSLGPVTHAGVEGTASYGKDLASLLVSHGLVVFEVTRPNRQVRRRNGKSDPADAVAAARAVISGEATTPLKAAGGPIEGLRAVRMARRSADKARTQVANQLAALARSGPAEISTQLRALTTAGRVAVCAEWDEADTTNPLAVVMTAMGNMARRHQALTEEINQYHKIQDQLTQVHAPALRELFGIGPDVASQLLITAGDNPNRLGTDAQFAALCGVSPVDASSGRQKRHRLNRGGDRQANNALWRIIHTRWNRHQPTITYRNRRRTEGLTDKEIRRCLKRHVTREVLTALKTDLGLT